MPFLTMRHDFRAPADGSSTQADIYSAAMEQFRWADAHGGHCSNRDQCAYYCANAIGCRDRDRGGPRPGTRGQDQPED